MEIYRRWMEQSVMQALETWRIVSIAGARQCGKTTLSFGKNRLAVPLAALYS